MGTELDLFAGGIAGPKICVRSTKRHRSFCLVLGHGPVDDGHRHFCHAQRVADLDIAKGDPMDTFKSVASVFAPDLFAGRCVLVTGGTSGIGLACARAFCHLGASVIATGATQDESRRASDDPENKGISFSALNVRDGRAVLNTISNASRLDIVINSAGVIRRDAEHDPAVFAEVLDINLTGTMRVCTAAREKLTASKGSVINIASILAFISGSRVPAYSASKGGIGQLTKSLAAAWVSDGIRVNAVAPGWIATPLTQALQDDPERSRQIVSRTLLGRWGAPDEVASGVVFLASPAAKFITGTILSIDGGYLAT
jgi:NAD(P)-dependent dehydrogenase (short-subunit alcohol dehydrogenase family)